jgi:acetyl esterase
VTTPQGLDRLDPEFVAQTTLFRVPLSDETLPAIRQSLNDRRAEQARTLDPGQVVVERGSLALPGAEIALRIYRGTTQAIAPAVVFFHSGGLVLGNLDTDHARCVALAGGAQCVLISVDYRLAPEHPYPAAFEDCSAVTAAVLNNPDGYGVDPARVALSGSSAGAGLAAAVSLRLRDQGGLQPCFQLLHQPMLDHSCATESMREFVATPGFDSESARFSWAGYLAGRSAEPYISPAWAASLAGLPPAYVCCSEVDPLRDEALQYAQRLVRAGVPTELHLVAGTCHGFDSFGPNYSQSITELQLQVAALRRAFDRTELP